MAELRVTSGGVAAETGPMLEQALRLQRASALLAENGRRLQLTSWALRAAGGASAAAASRVEESRSRCALAAEEAQHLAEGLRSAAGGYGAAEQGSSAAATALSAMLAGQLGRIAPFLLGWGLGPGRLSLLLAAAAAGQAVPWVLLAGAVALADAERRADVVAGLQAIGARTLSDTAVVAGIRLAVQSSDDFLMGWAGVPGPVRQLLGEQGLGVVDTRDTAGWLLGAAGAVGLLRETPVAVAAQRSQSVAPPVSVRERVDRIPTTGDRDQVRVERYVDAAGGQRFEVFIGPTLSAALVTNEEPLDPASIVNLVAGRDGGSLRAVEQALEAAGARPGDPVVASGYSQGGLVAAALAERADYDVQGIVTVGAPSASIDVPESTTWLSLLHDEDWLAAAGGEPGTDHSTTVSRAALPEGFDFGDDLAPAHDLGLYGDTAAMADAHDDPALRATIDDLAGFAAGAVEGEATTYRATRTEP